MNLPLFHDPLEGVVTVDAPTRAVTVDAPVRETQFHRPARVRATNRPTRHATHGSESGRSARLREVAKVAEDLQALMDRTAVKR